MMKKDEFDIKGMSCSSCSSNIEKNLSKLEGIHSVQVNLLQNSMSVEYDPEMVNVQQIEEKVKNVGYGASLKDEVAKDTVTSDFESKENKEIRLRLWISFLFWIPLFYLSMGHMLGLPIPDFFVGEQNILLFSFTQFLLTLPVVLINKNYFINGFRSLFRGVPNMDSLVATGSSVAFVYGIFILFKLMYGIGHQDIVSVYSLSHELYFESAATILALITLGKFLEDKSKRRTSDAINKLKKLSPDNVMVERNGEEIKITVDEIVLGDIIVIRSGDRIPVDGIVTEGSASVDESALTGESMPVYKQSGESVVSAAICQNGFFKFRATRIGKDTTLAQIIRLVEEASGSKAPIARLADKISGVFVPIVIVIAFFSVFIWLLLGYSFDFALSIGIAVLVISCPCALGLATPVAIMVGTGKGAENGILIKSAEALEILHSVNTVVLDKTGTITEGKPRITDIIPMNNISQEQLIQIAASIEKNSGHPLALAILDYAKEKKISLLQIESFRILPGKGIEAYLDGERIFAGNLRMVTPYLTLSVVLDKEIDRLSEEGKTPLLFVKEKRLLGVIAVADTVKPSSGEAVSRLRDMGINVVMLTGDNKKTAEAIRKRLNISHVVSEVLPQEKEQEIVNLQQNGNIVAMVGDGINDAPALARANVGIAIGAGTDIAIESADIVLMKSDLLDVVTAVRLSKSVIRNVKENLFWAFIYNVIGIPLATGAFYIWLGWKLDPMFAAAAMSLSSVCVVLNALRLRFFRPDKQILIKQNVLSQKRYNIMKQKRIFIEGMSCGHCSARVESALNKIEGVEATVDLKSKSALVKLSHPVNDELLKAAIVRAGYEVSKIQDEK